MAAFWYWVSKPAICENGAKAREESITLAISAPWDNCLSAIR